jgi:hypothetical protein
MDCKQHGDKERYAKLPVVILLHRWPAAPKIIDLERGSFCINLKAA